MGFMDKMKGMVPKQSDFAMRDRAMRLHQAGVSATGTLNAIQKNDRQDMSGAWEYTIDVHVTPPDGAAYDVTFTQYLLDGMLGAWAQPGGSVNVRIDPEDPSSAMLMGGA